MLSIRDLQVEFTLDSAQRQGTTIRAVRGLSLDILQGESVAVVGESGAGKSQVFHALMGLLPGNGRAQGSIDFLGQPLLNQPANVLNNIRGKHIGMIFQDPMTALNPYLRIGRQLTEVLEIHQKIDRHSARKKAIEMLEKVQINHAEKRFDAFPHELSGGMRQRVVIAMALLCEPKLIIADEPTTALDVTVQTEIIRLLKDIHGSLNTSLVLITHDLPLVAGICQRIVVMYAGRIVEIGSVEDIFYRAQHPYTQALLAATPQNSSHSGRLKAIKGQPPDPQHLPQGCAFHPRCEYASGQCLNAVPAFKTFSEGHRFACVKDGSQNESA